ncbi:substrate-binding periplasmic protein [Magnetococcus sp. PR-3]|uniref:substrate-binding periplasmic protein n=1 Tax=Magnetococcus sp. PR-3 TaxID=3120355 RepID=UPI002FCE21BD
MRLLIALLCLIPTAHASSNLSLALLDFFPFGRLDHTQKPVGSMVDMIHAISKQAKLPIQVKLMPVPRALRAVTLGHEDLMISYKDEQMLPGVQFLGNVGCLTALMIPHKQANIATLKDLKGKRIGFITGGYFHIKFAHHYGLIPVEVPSNESMLKMTLRGRLDGFIINGAVLGAYRKGLATHARLPDNWQDLIDTPIPLETMETHLSISKQSKLQHLAPQLSQAIQQLWQAGTFQRIYDHYGQGDSTACNPQPGTQP